MKDENNVTVGSDRSEAEDYSWLMTSASTSTTAKYALDKACGRSWHVNASGEVWNSFLNATGATTTWARKKDTDSDDNGVRLCDEPPPDDHNPCDDPTTVPIERCDGSGEEIRSSEYTTEPIMFVYAESGGSEGCTGGILWFSSFDGGETWRIDYFECTQWDENQE